MKILRCGLCVCWWATAASAQTCLIWVHKFPSQSPAPRDGHAMASGGGLPGVTLFGGMDAVRYGDTWDWFGDFWNPGGPSGELSLRHQHAMAYDSARGVVVLFGGSTNTGLSDQTWERGAGPQGFWTQQTPFTRPSPRAEHAMAYDSGRHFTVLFGGQDAVGLNGQTWEWSGEVPGGAWTLRSSGGPSPRKGHAMAFDEARDVTVLFGGQNAGGLDGETWEWNGSAWLQQVVSGPTARSGQALAYLSTRGTVLLFGGQDAGGLSAQTWEWNGTAWSQVMISGPSARTEHAMAGFGNVVLFGGQTAGGRNNETWELTANAAVTITQHPASQTVCEGTPLLPFSVTAGGTPPLTYQWRKDEVDISGATASNYFISGPVNPSHAGSYDVVVANGCGSIISNPAVLTVNTLPSISQQPVGQSACVDDAVTFSVTAGGSPPPTYQWFMGANAIGGATQISLTIAPVATSDAGSYSVKLTNSCGMVQSNSVNLVVNSPVIISVHPVGDAVCSNDPVNFSVTASGSPPPTYQWRKDEVDIPNATASSYSIASADPGDAGDYDVVVTNACGPVISSAAHLAVDPTRLYVAVLAPPAGANSGATWTDAFTSLQSALAFAAMCPSVGEVWVAAGTYMPAGPGGSRFATFQLLDGVAIYGGFAGGETQLGQRDSSLNVTRLSGDLNGNDAGFPNSENCFHVVTGSATDASAILDGFTISGGNANGTAPHHQGAGILNDGGSPTLSGCVVSGNFPNSNGAGMANLNGAHPALTDCTYSGNLAFGAGGGLYSSGAGSSPALTRCTFSGNTAGQNGGGMCITTASATLLDCTFESNTAGSGQPGGGLSITGGVGTALDGCTFRGNSATNGGGMANSSASPSLTRCRFISNTAQAFLGVGGAGGGISNDFGSPSITNCVFVGNSADLQSASAPRGILPPGVGAGGGAIFTQSDSGGPVIRHCTIAGNAASQGGGVLNVLYGGPANVTVSNCILWGNAMVGIDLGASGVTEAAQITNRVFGGPPSALSVDHCCIQQLTGNLGGANNFDADPRLSPEGHLLAGSPCMNAGNSAGPPPSDLDGEPRPAGGGIDIGADELVDSDADGLPDWWETAYFGGPAAADPGADGDADGVTNLDEYELYGSHPDAPPYYVDTATGNDAFDGRAATPQGGGMGPKKTIQPALNLAMDGDTVLVAAGTYFGVGNRQLVFRGRAVVLRGGSGAAATVIDAGDMATSTAMTAVLFTGTAEGAPGGRPVLDGLTITNTHPNATMSALQPDYSRLFVRNCTLSSSRGGAQAATALGCLGGSLTFDGAILSSPAGLYGSTALFNAANVSLPGMLTLNQGVLQLEASQLSGPGGLHLSPGTLLLLSLDVPQPPGLRGVPPPNLPPGVLRVPSVIRCSLTGSGDVQIDLTQQLILGEGAFVDLSGNANTSGCADPSESDQWGTFIINGALVVRGATVQNTNFDVHLASFLGGNQIINNDIRLLQASAGYGGEFLVGTGSTVRCNVITSEGDRYLDLDPDPSVQPPPVIEDNRFHVIIKQGVTGTRGELLELRSPDYDNAVSNGLSGAYELADSPGYSDTWTLERLEVLPGAKVNLTNRGGFDFNPGDPLPDTVYVKDLIIGSNGVVNVGLQRLYYQTLTMGPGAEITDIPVLGFSLVVIQMEDQTEFDVRVRARVEAPPVDQPCTCPQSTLICTNGEEEDETTCRAGLIERIDTNGIGVMDMRTQAEGQQSASSVAAKGAFARAGEDEIVVAFEYLFVQNPAAELIVQLSDDPDVSENLVEIARVRVPADGRDGSVPALGGTGQFATFYGVFPRGNLNFHRGTYVELELRGSSTRVWIDDWDPQVDCIGCGDLNGSQGFESLDYLILLSTLGADLDALREPAYADDYDDYGTCLDGVIGGDQYVDLGDLFAWDAAIHDPSLRSRVCNLYSRPADSEGPRGTVTLPGGLVIAGKPSAAGQADELYAVSPLGVTDAGTVPPTALPRGHGRLLADRGGQLHQIHASLGLVRLSDGEVIIGPRVKSFAGQTVHVGPPPVGQSPAQNCFCEPIVAPMADAAFHPSQDAVYVVPVLVTPAGGTAAHKAAAKLLPTGGGDFSVAQLYESPDAVNTPCSSTGSGCGDVPETDRSQFREIEVSADGNQVFIAAAQAINQNDYLLTFNEVSGGLTHSALLTIPAPSALLASRMAGTSYLYLTSGVLQDPGGVSTVTRVYRMNVSSGVVPAGTVDIDVGGLGCNDPSGFGQGCVAGVSALAEQPDGTLWVTGFTSPVVPVNLDTSSAPEMFGVGAAIFTRATLSSVAYAASWSPPPSVTVRALTGGDLALPVSMAWNCAATQDVDEDDDVDLRDYAGLQACFTGSGSFTLPAGCSAFNANCDADVDLLDYQAWEARVTGPL